MHSAAHRERFKIHAFANLQVGFWSGVGTGNRLCANS